MAVIEEERSDVKDIKSPPSSATTMEPTGYNSDGYETASDTELNDIVTERGNHSNSSEGGVADRGNVGSVERGDGEVSREVIEEECQKTEIIDTEATEKTLARSNDAKNEGNSLFKEGLYDEALLKYEFAVQIAPDGSSSSELRSMCHANRAACFSKLGKYEETITECTKALELNPNYMKPLLRRGEAHEKLEHYDESIADMNKILELDPSNEQARRTIIRLKPLADEKREKMKEEMIGKLKEMGNSILGRFGMSVDNFKAVKDPNTGSYSINFQR